MGEMVTLQQAVAQAYGPRRFADMAPIEAALAEAMRANAEAGGHFPCLPTGSFDGSRGMHDTAGGFRVLSYLAASGGSAKSSDIRDATGFCSKRLSNAMKAARGRGYIVNSSGHTVIGRPAVYALTPSGRAFMGMAPE